MFFVKPILSAWAVVALALPACAEELVQRTELQRKPVPGNPAVEVVISKLVLLPGGRIPLHSHPGDEHAVIVVGGDVYLPNGKEAAFADGTVLFFPAGSVHGGITSRDDAPMIVYTTHVVEAEKPMTVLAE